MSNTANNVSAGKPKVGGAVFRAPFGTLLPTRADTDLDESVWKGEGYISEDGVTNSNTRESAEIKAWGGDVVDNVQTDKKDTYKMTFIECLNLEVLKTVYGDGNVSGALETGIAIKVNSAELQSNSYVIDTILKNNALKRHVIPNAKVASIEDVVYKDDEPVGYTVTLSCLPDSQGNTHYEYIIRKPQQEAIPSPTASPMDQSADLWGTPVSDVQGTDLAVGTNAITGTLKNVTSGALADRWGAGHFLAIQISDIDSSATSVKIGMYPSQGSGLIEIIDDPDKSGVFKVTDKNSQVFRTVITDGTRTTTKDYNLAGLVMED